MTRITEGSRGTIKAGEPSDPETTQSGSSSMLPASPPVTDGSLWESPPERRWIGGAGMVVRGSARSRPGPLGETAVSELGEDAGGELANSRWGKMQPVSDRCVAVALGDQPQDLALLLAQLRGRPGDGRFAAREPTQYTRGHRRAEDCLAAGDRPDRLHELLLAGAFEDIPAGAGLHRGKHRVIVVVHRQHQHPNLWVGLHDLPGRLHSVQPCHGLPWGRGRRAWTRVPVPGMNSTVHTPPSSAARSAIEPNPTPPAVGGPARP